jgi:hypothetical protein
MNSVERIKAIDELNKDAIELGINLLPVVGASVKLEKANGDINEQLYPGRTMTKSFYKLNCHLLMQPHTMTSTDVNDSSLALPTLRSSDLVTVVNKLPVVNVEPTSSNNSYPRPSGPASGLFLMNKVRMSNSNDYSTGIIIGTGSDPESLDSYKLTSPIIDGQHTITSTTEESAYDVTSGKWSKSFTKSFFQSNVNVQHTITEVGFFTHLMHDVMTSAYATFVTDTNYLGLLLDRIVLDESLDLAYGDKMTVSYNITMQMPWANTSQGGDGNNG